MGYDEFCLTRPKISDRELDATRHETKAWMANTHSVNRRLARGSLHRLVRCGHTFTHETRSWRADLHVNAEDVGGRELFIRFRIRSENNQGRLVFPRELQLVCASDGERHPIVVLKPYTAFVNMDLRMQAKKPTDVRDDRDVVARWGYDNGANLPLLCA